ncbi:response regulator [Paenibacillus sp. sgz302251]|uniref:response regulator n=1 Tax=Paenibacillus sp. sgz302251 TaxID=3414493 RepID=UPI003C7B980E
MYKALIVDDEIWIKRSLKTQINWESLGVHNVSEASDGEEAYRIAVELKPDIIITDVKMPRMDGIELTKLITHSMPSTKVIILSGYAEFELVRQALSHRVVDYILKPINETELYSALRRSIEEISKERQRNENDSRMLALLNRSLPLWSEKCFYDLIHNQELTEADGNELVNALQAHVMRGSFSVLMIKDSTGCLTLDAIKEKFTRHAGIYVNNGFSLSHFKMKEEFLHVMEMEIKGGNEYAVLAERSEIIRQVLNGNGSHDVFVGAGGIRTGWRNLAGSYREAVYACRHAALNKELGAVSYHDHFGRKETHEVIEEIKTYVQEAYADEITLDQVAHRFFLNSSYLSRLFKQVAGENFVSYVTRIRIEEANRLLLQTDLPIYQVAYSVGFENTNYFSKTFKKYRGYTPAECKKLYR